MIKKILITSLLIWGLIFRCFSQIQQGNSDIRLEIIVIPLAKENEDITQLLNGSIEIRIAMDKLKTWLDNSNLPTTDFNAYRNNLVNKISNSNDGAPVKLNDAIRKNFVQDIIIEVRPDIVVTGTAKKAVITIDAYENVSAQTLFHFNFQSPPIITSDNAALIVRAFGSDSSANYEKFREYMHNKIDKIKEAGMPLQLRISFASGSHYHPGAMINSLSKPLSSVIENWIKNNSKSYQVASLSNDLMFFSLIRLPFINKEGNHYTPFKFSSEFREFLKSFGVSDIEISSWGGRIYITIK